MSALESLIALGARHPEILSTLGRAAAAALKSKDPWSAMMGVLLREVAKRTAHATAGATLKKLRKVRGK